MDKLCKNCVHWIEQKDRYSKVYGDIDYDPITLDDITEERREELFPHEVRRCQNPKTVFYQYPASDGVALMDGSEYVASMATGPNFGCVNFTPNDKMRRGETNVTEVKE